MVEREDDIREVQEDAAEATEEARERRGREGVEGADDPGRAGGDEPLEVDEGDEEISAF
jgi:hypothetical protein